LSEEQCTSVTSLSRALPHKSLRGHLDAGGHFHVKQEEVQPGYWELAVLDVEMKGKALFFETIDVQEETRRMIEMPLPIIALPARARAQPISVG
jgi:hypothetical protein